jgi:UDP-3-O-[3-hydroxymyristoyl] glucosamine N-acyltransferase
MELTIKEIAGLVAGKIKGDPDVVINSVSKIDDGKPQSLSFLANPKYTDYIYTTQASAILVSKDFVPQRPVAATLILVEDAYIAFAKLLEAYNEIQKRDPGLAETARIDAGANVAQPAYIGEYVVIEKGVTIAEGAQVYPQVFIGEGCEIGKNVTLYPGVKLYPHSKIGDNCIIHSGTVIGSDGFGFAPANQVSYMKVPQIGKVIIEDNVEIGANCTIDKATMGATVIRKGVKLDNLIQVAHNVEIGENTVIAAQSGISGSSKIGKNGMIGGQVGIAGHIEIADNVMIGAKSGISGTVKEKGITILGAPAFEISKFRRAFAYFKNLPKIVARIDKIEKQLKETK